MSGVLGFFKNIGTLGRKRSSSRSTPDHPAASAVFADHPHAHVGVEEPAAAAPHAAALHPSHELEEKSAPAVSGTDPMPSESAAAAPLADHASTPSPAAAVEYHEDPPYQPLSPTPYTCAICFTENAQTVPRFECAEKHHDICADCFELYVESQLHSQDELKFPLTCPGDQDCGFVIKEQVVAMLVGPNPPLWRLYQKLSIKFALDSCRKTTEVVLVCPDCGEYTVLYEPPADPNHWKKESKMKESLLKQRIQSLEEERDKKIKGLEAKSKFEKRKKKKYVPSDSPFHAKLDEVKQEYDHKIKELTSAAGDEKDEVDHLSPTFFMFQKGKLGEFKSDQDSEKHVRRLSVTDSTKYFSCPLDNCQGAFCVACMKPLKKHDIHGHRCQLEGAEVDSLYEDVLEALAKASVRACPKCGYSAQKDLECTHMTCPKCEEIWCYVCGRPAADFGGQIYTHNKWTLNSPPNTDQCPMYLQNKWGDVKEEHAPRMTGDPAKALMKFHQELQRKAIDALKKKAKPETWDKMMEKYFPRGIF
eukprot:TRINITY_DN2098_c0_g1_i2.p1 TRINITY_DN2098_c0_g1~~TRINITY_DN2098_c0_g1_i2.p1  ORF type:complete len:532 (-),score=148.83 TRINITY_DN2098_c0_g1_i2:53-1648(-)